MNVLLVSANLAIEPYPVYPLGMSVVANALAAAGHEVRMLDLLHHDGNLDAVSAAVAQSTPGAVGISIRNIDNVNCLHEERYLAVVREVVQRVRQMSDAAIIIGGSGVSVLPEAVLRATGADYGIVGEGERLAVDLVARLARRDFPKERLFRSRHELRGRDIGAALYAPDIMEFYLKNSHIASLQTKRGCPKRCVYCSYPLLEGRRIRSRDPSDVVDDIERLAADHGVRYFFFTDSVFNDADGHYRTVLIEMQRRGLCIPWTAFFTPQGLDQETVALMKAVGLSTAEVGADGACDTMLQRLGKDFEYKDIIETNALFTHNGIATANHFIFGGPGETRDTVAEGIAHVQANTSVVSFLFVGIRLLPGTPILDLARTEHLISDGTDLLDPVYYLSPHTDKTWLEQTLTEAFRGLKNCVFPPDSLNKSLKILYKMGYTGSAIEFLAGPKAF